MSDNPVSQTVSNELMEVLLKDPVKRNFILDFIKSEKAGFESYKKRELKEKKNVVTPIKRLNDRNHCESPTALQRRRALEGLTSTSETSSEQSDDVLELNGPKVPFEELLKGVIAYVEVKKKDVDRSAGIKIVMRCMGAVVQDTFTRDVTHVVFKDGSFTTYQKAKLMGIHLVSVLWLDAVKRNGVRVPEKNYPAFGSEVCEENVSTLCSQLQKDYEDIIRDEKRRSSSVLHKSTTSSIHEKRRSLMTPRSSAARHYPTERVPKDRLVETILRNDESDSPEMTSDDSDCGMINGESSKKSKSQLNLLRVSPSVTDDATSSKSSVSLNKSGSYHSFSSSGSKSLISHISSKNRRKTVNIVSDMILTPNYDESHNKSASVKQLSRNIQNTSTNDNSKKNSTSVMSSLRISTDDTDRTKSGLDKSSSSNILKELTAQTSVNRNISAQSTTINDSSKENSISTMSSLRISTDDTDRTKSGLDKSSSNKILQESTAQTSTMSSLRISSESSRRRSDRFKRASETCKENRTVRSTRTSTSSSKENSKWNHRPPNQSDEKSDNVMKGKTPAKTESSKKKDKRRSSTNEHAQVRRTLFTSNSSDKLEVSSGGSKNQTSSTESSSIEDSVKKKTRKLFNPDDDDRLSYSQDDREREERIKNLTKRKQKKEFIDPNDVLITTTPLKPSNLKNSTNEKKRKMNKSFQSEGSDESFSTESKKKEKKKRVQKTSSSDERLGLLAPSTEKENCAGRRSQRISLSQTKPNYTFDSSESSTDNTGSSLRITPIKRRSTLDFQSQSTGTRKVKSDLKKISSIVCTKMHRHEVINFEKVVKKLGGFFPENKVSDKTTHLVAGESKRTINMLRAIARGCWVLKPEWLLKSENRGKWLPEEDYEATDFSPAVQQCRLQRHAFGSGYKIDIFENCGNMYVDRGTTPKCSELKELIVTCKGTVTSDISDASIVVGQYINQKGTTCVTELWILDSITFNKLKPFRNYLIKPLSYSPEV